MADFTGVVNPKRILRKREEASGLEEPAIPLPPKQGDMSQADFSYGRKRSPQEEALRQKKLVEKLRSRDSGY